MKDVLIHPVTETEIRQVIENPPHALLLSGNEGSGKIFIAKHIAQAILQTAPDLYPYYLHVVPDKQTITIDQIRTIKEFTKLKTTGNRRIRRIVLIEDAQLMNTEAQNALLKLLEEPPNDTVLILTVVGDRTLKPTIYSRVQRIRIRPISLEQATQFSRSKKLQNDIQKLHMLSQGDAGLFVALAQSDDEHPLVSSINQAKALFTDDIFHRLIKVDAIIKDKSDLRILIMAMKRIAAAALDTSVKNGNFKMQHRWIASLESIHSSEKELSANANTKLLVTDLLLTL